MDRNIKSSRKLKSNLEDENIISSQNIKSVNYDKRASVFLQHAEEKDIFEK